MSAIPVANAPCSWGVLEFEGTKKEAGYGRVLDEMAQAGYAGTELGDWGFMPTDPPELARALTLRKLEMLGAFVPVALAKESAHEPGAAAAVLVARLLAAVNPGALVVLADDNGTVPARTQNAGRISPQHGLDRAAWRVAARGAERVAQAVRRETGLATVLHHHCAGYVETPAEIDTLLSLTSPELLSLCLDTGHYAFAGGDPLQALDRHWSRIRHVHFKDCSPEVAERSRREGWDYFASVRGGVFCELGQGAVPFAAIVKDLRARGYRGWIVVEQDVLPGMGTPLESARRNRAHLSSLGL
jgi:inosose dehydratase